MPQPKRYPDLLDEAIAIAESVVRVSERDRVIDWLLAWLLSLLCSIVHSGKSVRLLLRSRMVWDSPLICRKMNEAAFTIHYLLNNPGKTSVMRDLLRLEIDFDSYKFLEAGAAREDKTVGQFFIEKPELAVIKKRKDAAQSKHDFLRLINKSKNNKKQDPTPGRKPWRDISWQEKMAGLLLPNHAKKLIEFTMHEGDAVAHLRPHHIRVFSNYDPNRKPRFRSGPVSFRSLYFNPWTMPILALLIGADQIIDHYNLPKALSKRIERVMEDIKSHRRRNEQAAAKASANSNK